MTVRLREIRQSKGISPSKMARDMNTRYETLRRWEAGDAIPSYKTLLKLAKYLDTTPDYIMGRVDQVKKETEEHEGENFEKMDNNEEPEQTPNAIAAFVCKLDDTTIKRIIKATTDKTAEVLSSIQDIQEQLDQLKVIQDFLKNKDSNEYLSRTDVAKKLGLSSLTVSRMVDRGELPKPALGHHRAARWLSDDIREFIEQRANKNAAAEVSTQ